MSLAGGNLAKYFSIDSIYVVIIRCDYFVVHTGDCVSLDCVGVDSLLNKLFGFQRIFPWFWGKTKSYGTDILFEMR